MTTKTVVIPINDKNRQGIDDLLEEARSLFLGSHKYTDAIVVETDNDGLAILAQALADSSGQARIEMPTAKVARKNGNRYTKAKKDSMGLAINTTAPVQP